MPAFSAPLGGGAFDLEDRYDRALRALRRLTGQGGFSTDPDSLVQRTLRVFSILTGGVSLATSRLLENVFPNSAHPEDDLSRHERWRRLIVRATDGVDQRWANLQKVCSDRGGARFIDVQHELEYYVGVGNAIARYNTAAALDAAGESRKFVFAVAYEVPLTFITTLGQVDFLDGVLKKYKPITVGCVVTHEVAHGFLTDDDQSLTDRDVLDE